MSEDERIGELTELLRKQLQDDRSDAVRGIAAKVAAVVSPIVAVVAAIWAFGAADATQSVEFKQLRLDVTAMKETISDSEKRLNEERIDTGRLRVRVDQSALQINRLERRIDRLRRSIP